MISVPLPHVAVLRQWGRGTTCKIQHTLNPTVRTMQELGSVTDRDEKPLCHRWEKTSLIVIDPVSQTPGAQLWENSITQSLGCDSGVVFLFALFSSVILCAGANQNKANVSSKIYDLGSLHKTQVCMAEQRLQGVSSAKAQRLTFHKGPQRCRKQDLRGTDTRNDCHQSMGLMFLLCDGYLKCSL